MTFPEATQALAAADRLLEEWGAFQRRERIRCPMNIVVHRGELYAFRSFLLGHDLNVAMDLETETSRLVSGDASIFITGHVRDSLVGSTWEGRLHPLDYAPKHPQLTDIALYRLT